MIMSRKEILRTIWELSKNYFSSENKWRIRGLLAFIIALSLLQVYLLVMINTWYNDFYNVIQAFDYGSFWGLLGEFAAIAFTYVLVAVYAIYLKQMLQIKWREWMTKRYLEHWMVNQTYYRLQVLGKNDYEGMDNPDQRISEDINQFITYTLTFILGIIKEGTTLVAFVFILWNLSGIIELPIGDEVYGIPGYMVFVSLFYSFFGTVLAHLVGRKLININYNQQRFEADFRFNMMRVRENSESVAFYAGEVTELVGYRKRFEYVIKNFWSLMNQTKLLNLYTVSYSQLAVIVPLILAGPKYFAGEILLGGLMQTLTAFDRVQGALSYFVTVYDSIASYIAVIRRLGGFTKHMAEVDAVESSFVRNETPKESLYLDSINVNLPNGEVLLNNLTLELNMGDRLLISGASGCGKSTLLRVLAGIWPYGSGNIYIPSNWKTLFLPQRPYLPLGTLRGAIYYPQIDVEDSSKLVDYMKEMGLKHLIEKLDVVDDWSRILSLGEQQRVAFIRVLLFKPQILFLDESTSAIDEDYENMIYVLIRKYFPEMITVSVGHRTTLVQHHEKLLKLDGKGGYTNAPITPI